VSARRLLPVLLTAAASLALTVIALVTDPRHAAFAYLAAFGVGLSGALGGLIFLMVAHVSRARWFVVLRRLAEALAATLPLFVLLFVPVALLIHTLYPWARPLDTLDVDARHAVLARGAWFRTPFFLARAGAYFATWTGAAALLRHASLRADAHEGQDEELRRLVDRQYTISGLALPPMALTITFAAFDWFMSVDPTWTSDVYGVYFFAGGLAAAIGTLAVVAWVAKRAGALPDLSPAHFHALGRVLLTSVVFWAYIAFCQFLLVWIADLPREVLYYSDRVRGGFLAASVALGIAHFGVPFLALLSRRLKRQPGALALVGGWMVAAHALDVYWLVVPAARDGLHWLDAAPVIFVVSSCVALGAWRFTSVRPLPANDPHLRQSLRYESP
jgi:hypothetical protein